MLAQGCISGYLFSKCSIVGICLNNYSLELFCQGIARAQYNIGVMYREGRGVELSFLDAGRWYTKAAYQVLALNIHISIYNIKF